MGEKNEQDISRDGSCNFKHILSEYCWQLSFPILSYKVQVHSLGQIFIFFFIYFGNFRPKWKYAINVN